jgi:hypothetical protein
VKNENVTEKGMTKKKVENIFTAATREKNVFCCRMAHEVDVRVSSGVACCFHVVEATIYAWRMYVCAVFYAVFD